MKYTLLYKMAFVFNLVCMALLCAAQNKAPEIKWQRCLGGRREEAGACIQNTRDGGSVIVSYSSSFNGDVTSNYGGYDFWVVKLDGSGNIQFQKNYGGSKDDRPASIQQTIDGGYIMAGSTLSNNIDITSNYGFIDGWIVKLDKSGKIEWQRNCGGSGSDNFDEVIETFDHCYITIGSSNSTDYDINNNHGGNDCWVTKFSHNGKLLWSRSFGGSEEDYGKSVVQTKDSGFIVLASTGFDFSNNTDCRVIRLDKEGNIVWHKRYGGEWQEFPYSIKQTAEGGYIFCAATVSKGGDVSGNHGGFDYWVVKLNTDGSIDWQKCFGGTSDDYPSSIEITADKGYVVAGYTKSNNGDVTYNHTVNVPDVWLVKLDTAGVLSWQKSYGGTSSDIANSVVQTTDGGLLMTGETYSDDGDVSGIHGFLDNDTWVLRVYPDKELANTFVESVSEDKMQTSLYNATPFLLYPNPAKNSITISKLSKDAVSKISVISSKGESIAVATTKNSSYCFNIKQLPKGLYYIIIQSTSNKYTMTFIKE